MNNMYNNQNERNMNNIKERREEKDINNNISNIDKSSEIEDNKKLHGLNSNNIINSAIHNLDVSQQYFSKPNKSTTKKDFNQNKVKNNINNPTLIDKYNISNTQINQGNQGNRGNRQDQVNQCESFSSNYTNRNNDGNFPNIESNNIDEDRQYILTIKELNDFILPFTHIGNLE